MQTVCDRLQQLTVTGHVWSHEHVTRLATSASLLPVRKCGTISHQITYDRTSAVVGQLVRTAAENILFVI